MNALILVDIQNDFLPGGALAVPDGDAVIPIANDLMKEAEVVVATQDWHPPDHGSFAVNHPGRAVFETIDLHGLSQTLWPVHCVEETHGAAFADALEVSRIEKVFRKGTRPEIDSYSGFHDNGRRHSTGMADWLRGRGVTQVTVCGLATDYCVKFTALDAIDEGFRTTLALGACRGVNLKPGDVEQAIQEMQQRGVVIA
ncbi:MAG: bifunctional nicotinamidase/pyrazinamidase [Akkermansiaceae bacterium]|jgi:nicotinamidase/pyrazinamidase|nr:bifunctional nicotinamidase/pyrazinamidase [Akkermansiaceae bacterium]